jgi:hypothetical protein
MILRLLARVDPLPGSVLTFYEDLNLAEIGHSLAQELTQ